MLLFVCFLSLAVPVVASPLACRLFCRVSHTAAAQNAPLFLKVFKDAAGSLPRQTDDVVRMQMHEVVYNSLDVVEERRTLGKTPFCWLVTPQPAGTSRELFAGASRDPLRLAHCCR